MTGNPLLNTQSNFKVKRRYLTQSAKIQYSFLLWRSPVALMYNVVPCWLLQKTFAAWQ